MLATHTIDPEDLFTITAGGFSATVDAFARDDRSEGLWFVSMVGSQTALKAIWGSLLKQPPDTAHIIQGADGMALSGGYQRCRIPTRPWGHGRPGSPGCQPPEGGTPSSIRRPPSTDSRGTPSSCWPSQRRRPRLCTTDSWTSAAPCPSTAPGPDGSGTGASWRGK